ncbi:50S ribosomal protein L22 [bacterium]|nr:50S ribosomal protein L22 [bacterium]
MKTDKENEGYVAKASLMNVRVSPQRARLVADLVRGLKLASALSELDFCDKKTAPLLKKLLLSAAANAKQLASANVDELYVKRIWVDEARKLKRFMPRAQGRATPIVKRSSSIHVQLDEVGA